MPNSWSISGSDSASSYIPFVGTVSSTDAATFNVQVDPDGQSGTNVMQGMLLSHCFADMLGIKDSFLPQIGSKVFCMPYNTTTCVILGVLPTPDISDEPYSYRTVVGQGDTHNDSCNNLRYGRDITKLALFNKNRPTDVVEGEYTLGNEFGVLLGLFQQMACLKGSELAQIQCFVLDDLVRMISHNFQHFSALGEFKIFHDGKRINLEYGATHRPSEASGKPEATSVQEGSSFEAGTASSDDKTDLYNIKNAEALKAVERLRIYLGGLGDFLNIMLTCPNDVNTYTLDGNAPTTSEKGLLDFHLGTDGGLHIRSVKEVFVEKTKWIRVPQRIRSPEDPEGDDAAAITYPVKSVFKFDDKFKFNEEPCMFFLQLRDYLAYVQEGLRYTNFKAHPKDFSVNDDASAELDIANLSKVDPETETLYYKAAAGMYLMPNGGVMFKDTWGSAIVMEGGNIYLQPAKDLVVQPNRNFIGKVGQFVNIASVKDIDFSSRDGGYRLKTELAQYSYSNLSGIVLHSNGNSSVEGAPEGKAIEDIGGIALKSNTGVYSFGSDVMQVASKNLILKGDSLLAEGKSRAILSSSGDTGQTIIMSPKGYSLMLAKRSIDIVTDGSLIAAGKRSTTVGIEKMGIGAVVDLGMGRTSSVQGVLKPDQLDSFLRMNNTLNEQSFQEQAPIFQTTEKVDALDFRYLDTEKYGLDLEVDVFPQTLAQQEDAVFETYGLKEWVETEINETLPFPGKQAYDTFFAFSSKLDNLEKIDETILPKTNLEAMKKEAVLYKASMNKYKVML